MKIRYIQTYIHTCTCIQFECFVEFFINPHPGLAHVRTCTSCGWYSNYKWPCITHVRTYYIIIIIRTTYAHVRTRTFSVLWFEAQNTSTVSDGVGVLLLLDAYECPVVEGSGRGAQSDAAGVVGQRLIVVAGFECLHG